MNKKRIILMGNEMLCDVEYSKGEYFIKKRSLVSKIMKNYDIYNLSYHGLTFDKAYNSIKLFTGLYDYNGCVLEINDSLIDNINYDKCENLLKLLTENSIKPVFVCLTNNLDIIRIVDELSNKYNAEVIHKDEVKLQTSKNYSLTKINKLIAHFCN